MWHCSRLDNEQDTEPLAQTQSYKSDVIFVISQITCLLSKVEPSPVDPLGPGGPGNPGAPVKYVPAIEPGVSSGPLLYTMQCMYSKQIYKCILGKRLYPIYVIQVDDGRHLR